MLRRSVIYVAVLVLAELLPAVPVAAQPVAVVINEVEFNPPGPDAGNEWVELYNPTTVAANVGGWVLQASAGQSLVIPTYSQLPAQGYLVLTFPQESLANTNEALRLVQPGVYGSEVVDLTPSLSDTSDDSRTWQRIPNGQDTDRVTDWQFLPATRDAANVVPRQASSISLMLTPTSGVVGQRVNGSGSISPAHPAVSVTVRITDPSGTAASITTATDGSSNYRFNFTLRRAGLWQVQSSWAGDADHLPATSASVSITASKALGNLTLTPVAPKRPVGQNATLVGQLTPARANSTITLTLIAPNGATQTALVRTNPEGRFQYSFLLVQLGPWQVQARWDGDADYAAVVSSPTQVIAEPWPLLEARQVIRVVDREFVVLIQSNSTVEAVQFNGTRKQLTIIVRGPDGFAGVARVTFPLELVSGPFTVDIAPTPSARSVTFGENATHATVAIGYTTSQRALIITGTRAIPEFPLSLLVLLIVVAVSFGLGRRLRDAGYQFVPRLRR